MSIVLLGIGYILGFTLGTNITPKPQTSSNQLLNYSLVALEQADILMANHELFNKDSSDLMAEYLENCAIIDSLVQTIE